MKRFVRSDSLLWIALSAATSGLSTYALLVFVAHGLGPKRFDGFSLYWAVLIAVSVGGFLPVEQIVARHSARGVSFRSVVAWASRWGALTVGVASVGLLGVVEVSRPGQVSAPLVLIFAVNLGAVALQSVVRGVAAGRHRLDVYACVVITDSLLRMVLSGALASRPSGGVEVVALAIAAGCWASVILGFALLRGGPPALGRGVGRERPARLSGEALSLVPAMLSMQVLLNSPIFVASIHHDRGVNAGRVLAITSLVRTAVFVAQAAQAVYVARIARLVHDHSPEVRKATAAVMGLALALASATVVGTVIAGPWLVRLLYGESFVVGRLLCLFVSLGVAVFLVAIVANDLAVARGMHRHSGLYWALGALAGLVSAVLLPDGNGRIFGPIIVGSTLALVLTVAGSRDVDRGRLEGVVGGDQEDHGDHQAADDAGPVPDGEDDGIFVHLSAVSQEPYPHQPHQDDRNAAPE